MTRRTLLLLCLALAACKRGGPPAHTPVAQLPLPRRRGRRPRPGCGRRPRGRAALARAPGGADLPDRRQPQRDGRAEASAGTRAVLRRACHSAAGTGRLRVHRRPRRPRGHQQPRRRGCQRHRSPPLRRPPLRRRPGGPGCTHRPRAGPAALAAQGPAHRGPGRLRSAQGRGLAPGHREPLRPLDQRVAGHPQRHRARPRRRPVRRVPPDRRGHQPRQLGRPAVRPAGRRGWGQRRHRQQQHRWPHRLRHSLVAGPGAPPAARAHRRGGARSPRASISRTSLPSWPPRSGSTAVTAQW